MQGDDQTPPVASADVFELKEYWVSALDRDEPQAVYDYFVRTYENDDENKRHFLMHLFSSLLYEKMGDKALELCDESFFYGCFHEILASLMKDQGVGSIDKIADFCGDNLGCQHGIGHGLVMHFGYQQSGLIEALEMCRYVNDPEVIDGCLGGVFMEYTMETVGQVTDAVGEDRRYFRTDFCYGLPTETKAACYFWVVQWYIIDNNFNMADLKIASGREFCAEAEEGYVDDCMGGIGYVVNRFAVNPDESIRLCQWASPNQEELEVEECLVVAAIDYGFFSDETAVDKLCDLVSGDNQSRCRSVLND